MTKKKSGPSKTPANETPPAEPAKKDNNVAAWLGLAGAVLAAVAGVIVAGINNGWFHDAATKAATVPASPSAPISPAAATSPGAVTSATAPSVPDRSDFVTESPPDNTPIHPGDHLTKSWTLRNSGGLAWTGRYLSRVDAAGGCTTVNRVPVADTQPGGLAVITVEVTAPSTAGTTCTSLWKMTDAKGNLSLAGQTGLSYSLPVQP